MPKVPGGKVDTCRQSGVVGGRGVCIVYCKHTVITRRSGRAGVIRDRAPGQCGLYMGNDTLWGEF